MEGKDPRIVCVVGPCSIHDPDAALDYAKRLKRLSKMLEDSVFLIMRVYCEKSRTSDSWKGLLNDPDLDGSHDIEKGIVTTRELLVELANLGVPAAAEFINPIAVNYYQDLISWGFIGARTTSSQPHRQMASGFNIPIGFKNTVFGDVDTAVQGILLAQHPQSFLGINDDGRVTIHQSTGNPLAHLVLRGSTTDTNFDSDSVATATDLLKKHQLPQRIMIDCSHGNSRKNYERQSIVFSSAIEQIKNGNHAIVGLMLESYLAPGRQAWADDPSRLAYGISITDPCIGWEETEELLLTAGWPTSINSVQK